MNNSVDFCVGYCAYAILNGNFNNVDFTGYTKKGINDFVAGWNLHEQQNKAAR